MLHILWIMLCIILIFLAVIGTYVAVVMIANWCTEKIKGLQKSTRTFLWVLWIVIISLVIMRIVY